MCAVPGTWQGSSAGALGALNSKRSPWSLSLSLSLFRALFCRDGQAVTVTAVCHGAAGRTHITEQHHRRSRMRAVALRAGLLALTTTTAHAQAAAQVGARPPKAVVTAMCSIGDMFGKLTQIKTDADCMAGCAGGTGACPAEWYPGAADECSPECGAVFEPFCEPPNLRPGTWTGCLPLTARSPAHRGSVRLHANRRAHGRHGRDGPILR